MGEINYEHYLDGSQPATNEILRELVKPIENGSLDVLFRNLSRLDTSKITDMSGLFPNSAFNQDISAWDTSSVTDMNNMFFNSKFNQPIGQWNVSNVEDMSRMFNESMFNLPVKF